MQFNRGAIQPMNDGQQQWGTAPEPSVGDLIKQLGQDTATLVRQELALAKVEVRQTGRRVGRVGMNVGIAAGLALAGIGTLSAALVLLLGQALDGAYWLAALLVAFATLAVAALLARGAMQDLKEHPLLSQETVQTLRQDGEWAAREAQEFKNDLMKNPAHSTNRL